MQNFLTYLLIKGFRLSFLEEAGTGSAQPSPTDTQEELGSLLPGPL